MVFIYLLSQVALWKGDCENKIKIIEEKWQKKKRKNCVTKYHLPCSSNLNILQTLLLPALQ